MSSAGRTGGTLAAVGLVVLALFVVPALGAPALGSPAPLAAGNSQQWAYGAEKWVNVSINLPNATYTQKAFFGWQVIFTATNTSNTTQAWEVDRTVAGSFYAEYCQPNCSAPTTFGNLSVTGVERDAGFANLTDTASVYVNGSAVPAVGLANASFENNANLNESMRYALGNGPVRGNASAAFDLSGAAHGAVSFSPALGLVPTNLSGRENWNSTSAFTSSGAWAVEFDASRTSFAGVPTSFSSSANGSVDLSGIVDLRGSDFGMITLANGQTVPVVTLAWTGPFDVVDGVILIPHAFDLFGAGDHDWDNDQLGSESIATSNLDIRIDASHHLEVVAAATAYASSDNTLATSSASPPSGATPMVASGSPSVIQAQPESVPQAQQGAACLAGGCSATSASAAHPWASFAIGLAVVGIAAVVLVGLAVGLRGRRGGNAGVVVPPAGAVSGGGPGGSPGGH